MDLRPYCNQQHVSFLDMKIEVQMKQEFINPSLLLPSISLLGMGRDHATRQEPQNPNTSSISLTSYQILALIMSPPILQQPINGNNRTYNKKSLESQYIYINFFVTMLLLCMIISPIPFGDQKEKMMFEATTHVHQHSY